METIVPRTWVPGTPRGFGDNKVASVWLNELRKALRAYSDAANAHDSKETRYTVTLEFLIDPESPAYRRQNLPHGTDLDNMVKQTIDGLSHTRAKDLPPGLNIIGEDQAVYRIVATKEHVSGKDETGVFVAVKIA